MKKRQAPRPTAGAKRRVSAEKPPGVQHAIYMSVDDGDERLEASVRPDDITGNRKVAMAMDAAPYLLAGTTLVEPDAADTRLYARAVVAYHPGLPGLVVLARTDTTLRRKQIAVMRGNTDTARMSKPVLACRLGNKVLVMMKAGTKDNMACHAWVLDMDTDTTTSGETSPLLATAKLEYNDPYPGSGDAILLVNGVPHLLVITPDNKPMAHPILSR